MFLYFSDCSSDQNIELIKKRGYQDARRLIKVFATRQHPSRILKRPILTVRQFGFPFKESEVYRYPGRGFWLPSEMEYYLNYNRLTEEAKEKARALFRFLNRPELDIARFAMGIINPKKPEGRQYQHPLDLVDGLEEARERGRNYNLHLDIFRQESVERLGTFVNLNDKELLVTPRECLLLEKSKVEGPPHTKEALG